jgi:ribonuclease T1
MTRRTAIKLVLTGVLSIGVWSSNLVQAREPAASGVLTVSVAELPRQGMETYRLIRQGGPFPHEKDGVVFGNRERLLPSQKRGYYREYTVPTPGARGRGARRIVCGGPPREPDACYYTADHYSSFRRIEP